MEILKKALQLNAKVLEIDKLPGQDEFCNFCLNDNINIYYSLKTVISNVQTRLNLF